MDLGRAMATLRHSIITWGYGTFVFVAAVAFATPLFQESTEEDPSGGAGLYAPLIALCVAATLLLEALKPGEFRIRRIPSIFAALGGSASAYFWVADAAKTHPFSWELPLVLLVILGLAAFTTGLALLFVLAEKQDSNK